MLRLLALAFLPLPLALALGDSGDLIVTGGRLFPASGDQLVANPGLLVRGGKLIAIGLPETGAAASTPGEGETTRLQLNDGDVIVPGFIDLHAHFGMDLLGDGRVDEVQVHPSLYLANGVTTVFPAGEMDPERVAEAQREIDAGQRPGPRILRSGPYFGTARPGWDRDMPLDELRAEVDALAASGVAGFKAKRIAPEQLAALIDQAHRHGLPVTGHLGSGYRNSVNPRDAIAMGIDRIEHFLGGDQLTADRRAYASLVDVEPSGPAFEAIVSLYLERRVFFDATLTAFGYYADRDPEVFTPWTDETRFFTPWYREWKLDRPPRRPIKGFEQIYRVKRRTLAAFHAAGGGPLITLGTDHPSDGDYLAAFGVHREMHAMVLAGLPPADVLRIATLNGARALGLGDTLGSLEAGKLADFVILRGDPLADIRATRDVKLVVKSGRVFDPALLFTAAEGRIGPAGPDDLDAWRR